MVTYSPYLRYTVNLVTVAIGSDSAREEIKRVINGGIIVRKANNKRSKKRRKNVRCFIKYIYIYNWLG